MGIWLWIPLKCIIFVMYMHGCHFCAEPVYVEFFFSVRILRNDKSLLYQKKCYYQVTRMILALMLTVLCIKMVFKRVKLQFIWQIKIECGFCEIKMTTMCTCLFLIINCINICWAIVFWTYQTCILKLNFWNRKLETAIEFVQYSP